MTDSLIIELPTRPEADATVRWCLAGMAATSSAPLESVVAEHVDADITLVVPGECVLLTTVSLPPIRNHNRRLQAAHFALEDQVAAPVDSLHVAIGNNSSGQHYPAAVVDRELLQTWLDAMGAARQQVVAIVPDTLCLPLPPEDACSLWLENERALLRNSQAQGFACDYTLLPTMLRATDPADKRIHVVNADAEQGSNVLEKLEESGYTLIVDEASSNASLFAQAAAPTLNLLQGKYAPTKRSNSWWQPLRLTAALLAALFIIVLFTHVVHYLQLRSQYNTLHTQVIKEFHTAFPAIEGDNDIRYRAQQALLRLQGAAGSSGIFPLLQATAAATSVDDSLFLQSLEYRNGELFLSLHAKSIQALEQLRGQFANKQGFILTVESANATSDGVQIRVHVSRSSKEAS